MSYICLKYKSNTRDTNLCTKTYTKSHVAIYIMNGNTHDKPHQLKLNDMNRHVYCHMGFGISFGIQFSVSNIILNKIF